MNSSVETAVKGAADIGSVGVVMATLVNWLPNIAAILTVLWLGARFYNEVMTAVYRRRREKRESLKG